MHHRLVSCASLSNVGLFCGVSTGKKIQPFEVSNAWILFFRASCSSTARVVDQFKLNFLATKSIDTGNPAVSTATMTSFASFEFLSTTRVPLKTYVACPLRINDQLSDQFENPDFNTNLIMEVLNDRPDGYFTNELWKRSGLSKEPFLKRVSKLEEAGKLVRIREGKQRIRIKAKAVMRPSIFGVVIAQASSNDSHSTLSPAMHIGAIIAKLQPGWEDTLMLDSRNKNLGSLTFRP
jgi:hypothetical protein